MRLLRAAVTAVDRLTAACGEAVSWLVLLAVLVSAYNALVRFLGNGLPDWLPLPRASNGLLELQWYLFGAVFMLAAPWVLQRGEHVRIDVLAGRFSDRARWRIDLAGHLIALLPFCLLMLWLCTPWALRSLRSGEVSASAGGLPLWPAKMLILAGFALLTLQALAELVRTILARPGAART